MSAYFDTGVVLKWYVPEPNSDAAQSVRRKFSPPVWLTPLHQVEFNVALRLKVFRQEIQPMQLLRALDFFKGDQQTGIYREAPVDFRTVCERANLLADRFSATLGTRTLDILHVASALELRCTDIVTADERQARLATAAGLKVTRL